MSDEELLLKKQMDVGNALRELKMHHGWKEYEKLFKELYKESVGNIIASEDMKQLRENKAVVKALEQIDERMHLEILKGYSAKDDLADKFNR